MRRGFAVLPIFILMTWILISPVIASDSDSTDHQDTSTNEDAVYKGDPQHPDIPDFFVPPPPFSEGIFPCSGCHKDMKPDKQRRKLEMFHQDIELKHAGPQQWCLDCHNADDRDKLHLIDGRLIDFKESYLLCGQCHGTNFRDWKAGVHGKRTGEWNGKKLYRLCVHCHNPHQPRFKPLTPKPPPVRPDDIK